jgi:uncharacterized protein with LGFP repeats
MIAALASTVTAIGLLSPVASAQSERIVAPEERDAYVTEFHVDPDNPPVIDGVRGFTEAEINEYRDKARQAEASGPPQEEITPGQMWSDKVGLPEGADKTEADESEVAIAREQSQQQTMGLRATATRCQTYWLAPQVCGAILDRYEQQGGLASWLGFPIEPMSANPDGQGQRQRFMGGFIYWHPNTGAHAVSNMTTTVWQRHGWEAGWLGYPLGGEVPVRGSNPIDGEINGWVQLFQGGRIYRSPAVEGFQIASINGLILDKWLELGGPNGDLGFPIADEAGTSDGEGRFSTFQNGVIYWHPETGAWQVAGDILTKWAAEGFESGGFGYPIDAPLPQGDGEYTQLFQGGLLYGQWLHKGDGSDYSNGGDAPGPNYYTRVLPCLDYERDGSTMLAAFSVIDKRTIVYLNCERFRNHIVSVPDLELGHFYNDPPTEADWYNFMSCVAHTLNAEPFYDVDKDHWGRQRGNTNTNTGSVVVVSPDNRVVTAWAGGPPKSGDWAECRQGLY